MEDGIAAVQHRGIEGADVALTISTESATSASPSAPK